MREELGIAGEDSPNIRDLFHQKYQGSRYSFGYPACPHLEDQTKLFALLKPEEKIGVQLTEGFMMEPEASVSALVFHHPEARYFAVGKIERDQVADYAHRKGMDLAQAERWLAPNLAYEP